MKFTGERFIPKAGLDIELEIEHMQRYMSVVDLVKDRIVLDAACGEGYGPNILAKTAHKVYGVDIDKSTINHAKKIYKKRNLSFIKSSIVKIPLPNKSLDVVVSFETIEHVNKKQQHTFLKEVKRLLKKDGCLVISTPDKEIYSANYRNDFHKNEFSEKEFRKFLRRYFRHLKFYYQKYEVASVLCNRSSGDLRLVGRKEKNRGKYLLVLCSNSNLGDIDISSYTPDIADKYRSLNDRIVELQDEVEKLAGWGRKLNKEVGERTSWAKQLDKELKVLREYTAKLLKEMEEKAGWAKSLDKELIASREHAAKLNKEVGERTSWAKQLDKELKVSREYTAKLQKEFIEKAQWAENLNKELKVSRAYTAKLQKEYDERSSWAKSLDNELAATKRHVAELITEIDSKIRLTESLSEKLDNLDELNAELDYELNEFKRSKIYKMRLAFSSASNSIYRLITKNMIVNSIASTAFLVAYYVFKKLSIPFNLSKAKSLALKVLPVDIDPEASGKRLKILYVTAMLPSKMHGGGTAMLNKIKQLSMNNDVSLISFIDFEKEREYVKEIEPYVKKIRIFERWSQRKVLDKGIGFIPDCFRGEFYCPELAEEISRELKREKYDILQFEYLQMAIYMDLCKIPKRTKVLISDHEIINRSFRERLKLFPLRAFWGDYKEYLRLFYYETSYLKRFSRVFVVTSEDAMDLLKYSPDLGVAVHPSGADYEYFSKEIAVEEFPSMVFLGNFQHAPNRDAAVHFSKKIFPKIKDKYPDIKFYIVGHMPNKEILKLAQNDKNIIVTSTVEDVRPFIQRASIFVAPIISGRGIRLKVVEAMAARSAIVATPLGCMGIEAENGKHLLIAKNDNEFVNDILLLLGNAPLRKELGSNASELAKKYDWKNIARQRLNAYLQLLKKG